MLGGLMSYVHVSTKTLVLRGYLNSDGYSLRKEYDWICHIDIHGDVAFIYGLKGVISSNFRNTVCNLLRQYHVKTMMFERHGKLKSYNVNNW